jgi:hypothetical protein
MAYDTYFNGTLCNAKQLLAERRMHYLSALLQ